MLWTVKPDLWEVGVSGTNHRCTCVWAYKAEANFASSCFDMVGRQQHEAAGNELLSTRSGRAEDFIRRVEPTTAFHGSRQIYKKGKPLCHLFDQKDWRKPVIMELSPVRSQNTTAVRNGPM